jgi:protein subunit release factor A
MFLRFKNAIKSLHTQSQFHRVQVFSTKNTFDMTEAELKPITRTLFKKLQSINTEYENLVGRLTSNNAGISAVEIQEIRKRTEENSVFHEIYLEFESIIKSKQELIKMQEEANNDKETIEFVRDEMKNYDEKLEDVQEKAIDLLIPADKYDYCSSIKIEIRSGEYEFIINSYSRRRF